MNNQPLQTELAKLLRDQESLIADQAHPLAIEQNNKEVWTLRTKYACGSTWGCDPAFDKWWVKQVAKARHLNIIRKALTAAAVAAFFGWLLYSQYQINAQQRKADEWAEKHLTPAELQKYYDDQVASYDYESEDHD